MLKKGATSSGRYSGYTLEVRAPRGTAQSWGIAPSPRSDRRNPSSSRGASASSGGLSLQTVRSVGRALPHHRHLDGRVGDETRYGEAHSALVLLHLELAQYQLRRLMASLGARDREHDDLAAGLVLGPAPELEEASIGQLAAELMQDQRAGHMTFQHLRAA